MEEDVDGAEWRWKLIDLEQNEAGKGCSWSRMVLERNVERWRWGNMDLG